MGIHHCLVHNHLPSQTSGLTPLELLTKTTADHKDLLRSHVWGCPVFVLDPKLKDSKKSLSGLVANARHLTTGFVSPRYHVVIDDLFQTVFSSGYDDALMDTICNTLLDSSRDIYVEDEFDSTGNIVYHLPPLDEVWLDESERRDHWEGF